MAQKSVKGEQRTIEQLREHYELEKELADKLRNATKQERRSLYSSVYDELFRRVPLHPQLTRKVSLTETIRAINLQMKLLRKFLKKDITYLEVGPGDCALSVEVSKYVKRVYAVDVSDEITKGLDQPANFQLVISDGSNMPVPPGSIDITYSNQLMEHLHPDDAFEQLEHICNALVPGGIYICITPNRLDGPHDISKFFDNAATGFHLKEYTTSELRELFKKAGFSETRVFIGLKGKYISVPAHIIIFYETLLENLPFIVRNTILRMKPFRILLGNKFMGIK